MTRMPQRRAALGLCLALAASGCADTPTTSFYTLSPAMVAGAATMAREPARVIAIGPVTLPDYLDRPQIVTRDSAYAITLAPFDQWAGPITDMVPRVLVENVAQALPDDRVVRFPQVSSQAFAYRVSVDINRFDVDKAGTATLIARWQVYDRAGKAAPLINDEVFVRPSVGTTYEAYAAAMSGALADLASRIAEGVVTVDRAGRLASGVR
jgi:uncharacterized lipoprotein YmbA